MLEVSRPDSAPALGAGALETPRTRITQGEDALLLHLAGTVQLLEYFFGQDTVVRDGLDFEQPSIGLKADAPQRGELCSRLPM